MDDNGQQHDHDDFERRLYQVLALLERAGEQQRAAAETLTQAADWNSASIKPSRPPAPKPLRALPMKLAVQSMRRSARRPRACARRRAARSQRPRICAFRGGSIWWSSCSPACSAVALLSGPPIAPISPTTSRTNAASSSFAKAKCSNASGPKSPPANAKSSNNSIPSSDPLLTVLTEANERCQNGSGAGR
jgi:hypothetical protein